MFIYSVFFYFYLFKGCFEITKNWLIVLYRAKISSLFIVNYNEWRLFYTKTKSDNGNVLLFISYSPVYLCLFCVTISTYKDTYSIFKYNDFYPLYSL